MGLGLDGPKLPKLRSMEWPRLPVDCSDATLKLECSWTDVRCARSLCPMPLLPLAPVHGPLDCPTLPSPPKPLLELASAPEIHAVAA